MFIKNISLDNYKILNDININFEKTKGHSVFPIISENGGGKSSLLQLIFAFLHCAFRKQRQQYLKTLLEYDNLQLNDHINKFISFQLEYDNCDIDLEFFTCRNGYNNLNFNPIIQLEALNNKKQQNSNLVEKIDLLNKIEKDIKNSDMPYSFIRNELKDFM